jgi:hypothetical protein
VVEEMASFQEVEECPLEEVEFLLRVEVVSPYLEVAGYLYLVEEEYPFQEAVGFLLQEVSEHPYLVEVEEEVYYQTSKAVQEVHFS